MNKRFAYQIDEYPTEKRMPRISTLERWAMEKGREEGREEGLRIGLLKSIAAGLEKKHGDVGIQLMSEIREITDDDRLPWINEIVWTAESLDEISQQLSRNDS